MDVMALRSNDEWEKIRRAPACLHIAAMKIRVSSFAPGYLEPLTTLINPYPPLPEDKGVR